MAYAPQPILDLFALIQKRIPQAQLGGVTGDVRHSFGYHLARNELPGNDYSVTLPLDRQGDAGAASALDVTFGAGSPWMVTCTNRLLTAARARDPRLRALREFCGTSDGQHTHPYDLSNGQDGPLDSWDSSHLWHIHLSFYRGYCNNAAALAPIADVFAGAPAAPSQPKSEEDEEMTYIIYDRMSPSRAALVDGGVVVVFTDGNDINSYRSALGVKSVPVSTSFFNRKAGMK